MRSGAAPYFAFRRSPVHNGVVKHTRRALTVAVLMALAAVGAVAACSSPETHPPVLGDCKDPAKCNTGGDGGVITSDASAKDASTKDATTPDAAADSGAGDASDGGDAGDGATGGGSDAGIDGNG